MKLIDNARHWWKLWSVQMNALFAAIAAAVVANPALLLGLIGQVPEHWRPVAAAATFMVGFVIPSIARITTQKKLSSDDER